MISLPYFSFSFSDHCWFGWSSYAGDYFFLFGDFLDLNGFLWVIQASKAQSCSIHLHCACLFACINGQGSIYNVLSWRFKWAKFDFELLILNSIQACTSFCLGLTWIKSTHTMHALLHVAIGKKGSNIFTT